MAMQLAAWHTVDVVQIVDLPKHGRQLLKYYTKESAVLVRVYVSMHATSSIHTCLYEPNPGTAKGLSLLSPDCEKNIVLRRYHQIK